VHALPLASQTMTTVADAKFAAMEEDKIII